MVRMSMVAAASLAIAVVGSETQVRERPNFSGHWVVDKPDQGIGSTTQYVVRQDARTFTVGHDDDVHAMTYTLDGQAREVITNVASIHNIKSIGKAAWVGEMLVVQRTDSYESGLTRTLKQTWSIDTTGLLTIESLNTTSAGESTTTKNVYKRKS